MFSFFLLNLPTCLLFPSLLLLPCSPIYSYSVSVHPSPVMIFQFPRPPLSALSSLCSLLSTQTILFSFSYLFSFLLHPSFSTSQPTRFLLLPQLNNKPPRHNHTITLLHQAVPPPSHAISSRLPLVCLRTAAIHQHLVCMKCSYPVFFPFHLVLPIRQVALSIILPI